MSWWLGESNAGQASAHRAAREPFRNRRKVRTEAVLRGVPDATAVEGVRDDHEPGHGLDAGAERADDHRRENRDRVAAVPPTEALRLLLENAQ